MPNFFKQMQFLHDKVNHISKKNNNYIEGMYIDFSDCEDYNTFRVSNIDVCFVDDYPSNKLLRDLDRLNTWLNKYNDRHRTNYFVRW